jgi:hypothetical protein
MAPVSAVALGRILEFGRILEWGGDVDGAKAAYLTAIDSGHADAAPIARSFLRGLLKEQKRGRQ